MAAEGLVVWPVVKLDLRLEDLPEAEATLAIDEAVTAVFEKILAGDDIEKFISLRDRLVSYATSNELPENTELKVSRKRNDILPCSVTFHTGTGECFFRSPVVVAYGQYKEFHNIVRIDSDGVVHKEIAYRPKRSVVSLGPRAVFRNVYRDQRLLSNMDHPNIALKATRVFKRPSGKEMTVVERADATLQDKFESREIEKGPFLRMMLQLIDAMEYLHLRRISHNDLKPDQCLVFGDVLKLTDFGMALEGNDDFKRDLNGLKNMLEFANCFRPDFKIEPKGLPKCPSLERLKAFIQTQVVV